MRWGVSQINHGSVRGIQTVKCYSSAGILDFVVHTSIPVVLGSYLCMFTVVSWLAMQVSLCLSINWIFEGSNRFMFRVSVKWRCDSPHEYSLFNESLLVHTLHLHINSVARRDSERWAPCPQPFTREWQTRMGACISLPPKPMVCHQPQATTWLPITQQNISWALLCSKC